MILSTDTTAHKLTYRWGPCPVWQIRFSDQAAYFHLLGLPVWRRSLRASARLQNMHRLLQRCHQTPVSPRRLAFFSILPPQTSGIAPYSYKLCLSHPDYWDVFAPLTLKEEASYLQQATPCIFPLSFFPLARQAYPYLSYVFALGNSNHHVPVVHYVLKYGGPEHFLYLHEAYLEDLLKPLGLSLTDLFQQSGIRRVFVNNERAKKLLLDSVPAELAAQLQVEVLFHPLEAIPAPAPAPLRDNPQQTLIASFGIPQPLKQTDLLIEAVTLLYTRGRNIKLLLAGYQAHPYADKASPCVQIIDSPSTEQLFSYMAAVDLACQLRPKPHGESSGCVMQLLSLGKNIITTRGFVEGPLEQYCHTVPPQLSAAELAEAIEQALQQQPVYNPAELCRRYSFAACAQELQQKILSLHPEKPSCPKK